MIGYYKIKEYGIDRIHLAYSEQATMTICGIALSQFNKQATMIGPQKIDCKACLAIVRVVKEYIRNG